MALAQAAREVCRRLMDAAGPALPADGAHQLLVTRSS
jgi:hypothetical protein